MCGEEDEYFDGPCYTRPRNLLCILLFIGSIAVTAVIIASVDLHREHQNSNLIDEKYSIAHTLEVKMRPQFYFTSSNAINESHIPSSVIMVKDQTLYSKAYCSFMGTGVATLNIITQADIDFVSPGPELLSQKTSDIEFRFEIPYGIDLDSTRNEILTQCPAPQCGRWDYRTYIGSSYNFINADSTFLTQSHIYLNYNDIIIAPIKCGCSMENPPRFSCVFQAKPLFDRKGALMISIDLLYPIAL